METMPWKIYRKERCPQCGRRMDSHRVESKEGLRKVKAGDFDFNRKMMGGLPSWVLPPLVRCPKVIDWEARRKARAFKTERKYTIFRFYKGSFKGRNLGYGPMTEEECQAHCRDPKTRKDGEWFDGYDKI